MVNKFMMKIVTWNVNGIRSLKRNITEILTDLDADVTSFQETKISRSQLIENIALIDGYTSYFSYPRKQSGYSGVATYCKNTYLPEDAEEGLTGLLSKEKQNTIYDNEVHLETFDLSELDSEGRVIITYHLIKFESAIKHLAIINVYCPCVHGTDKPERHLYKIQFCHLLEMKAKKLLNDGCFVLIIGDLNIAHTIMDHCDPGDENEFNAHEARQWLKAFLLPKDDCLNGGYFIDAYRYFYPDKREAYTCWNTKIGARLTNYGTRIDYVLVSNDMLPLLTKCEILSDYEGSDHCPVFAELKCDPVQDPAATLPSICTRLWPEFSGKQQTLKSFLKKTQALADNLTNIANSPTQTLTAKKTQVKSKQKAITSFFKNPNSSLKTSNESSVLNSMDCDREESTELSSNLSRNISSEEINPSSQNNQASEWKSLLKGPPKPPLCSGHNKECVLRSVKKKGPNYGRQFYMCPQPAGHASNPDANCNFFRWMSATKSIKLK